MQATMALSDIISLIQAVGFPIFVAVYLLVFLNRTIKELTNALMNNTIVTKDLKNFLEAKL